MKITCAAIAREWAELDAAEADLKQRRQEIADRRTALKQAQEEFAALSPALQALFAASGNGKPGGNAKKKGRRAPGEVWGLLKRALVAGGNAWKTNKELCAAAGVVSQTVKNLSEENAAVLEVRRGKHAKSALAYRLKPEFYAKTKAV